MNKSKILTSMLVIMIAGPALAETFPTDGYMQEDTTYDDAATYANTGVYEGSVTATAEYEDILYQIAAGTYLAAGQTESTTCPEGSYCEGLTDAYYSEEIDQGITICPAEYESSAGATSINECYTLCTVENANIAHALAVSGNAYYGTGTDTCEPTECEDGWHIESVSVNLQHIIETGDSIGHIEHDNTGAEQGSYNMTSSGAGISGQAMAFALDYGTNGIVTGLGRCSTRSGATNEIVGSLTNETGQSGAIYCYCQLTGYTPVGGTKQSVSSSWVFNNYYGDAGGCASSCTFGCAYQMQPAHYMEYIAAVSRSINSSAGSCEANAITINWVDAANASEATSSTVYEGDIVTPSAAKTKPGKIFKGWIFN